MDKSTKKGLIVVSLTLLAAGIAYHFYNKSQQEKSSNNDEGSAGGGGSTTGSSSGSINPTTTPKTTVQTPGKVDLVTSTPHPTKPINTGVQQAQIVPANNVLASNINAANFKAIYSLVDNKQVYNMNSNPAFKANKNQYLGLVDKARVSGSTYVIEFITNGVKYWVASANVGVKMN